jgi:hypothetical protein
MELVIYFIILLSITAAILVSTRNTRYFPGVLAAACIYWPCELLPPQHTKYAQRNAFSTTISTYRSHCASDHA